MTLRARIAIATMPALVAAVLLGAQAPASSNPQHRQRLVAFHSCGDLLAYAKSHVAPYVTPYGIGQGGVTGTPGMTPIPAATKSSGQEGVDYSGTNVQETGVDEPDVVKTNGATLFAVENGELEAVDVGSGRPKLLDTLKLDGLGNKLFLSGTHLLVLSRSGYWLEPMPAQRAMIAPYPTKTVNADRDRRVEPVGAQGRPDAVDRRRVPRCTHDRQHRPPRLLDPLPIALPYVTPSPGVATPDAARPRTAPSSPHRASQPGCRPTGSGSSASARCSCRNVRRPKSYSGRGC